MLLIFIDGIGLGSRDQARNPFARFESQFFGPLGGKTSNPAPGRLLEIDATLGIAGLPQSATGQTALFTGYNAAQILGYHCAGFPTVSLRPYLKNYSLLKRFIDAGFPATLINAYTEGYLQKISKPRGERFMSASTLMQLGSGRPLLTVKDVKENKSIYMDITHWLLKKQLPEITIKNPRERGRTLVKIARNYELTIFEYFLTDRVGHDGNWLDAQKIISHLDNFLYGIWEELNPDKQCVMVTSDHGNFEDLQEPAHTLHPIPLWIYGKNEEFFDTSIQTLYDIPRRIMSIYQIPFQNTDDLTINSE